MFKLKIDQKGMKQLIKRCQQRLDTEIEEEIIPFSKFNVRVDTGRLRESIAAKPSEFNPRYVSDEGRIEAVVARVTFGGTEHYPSVRIDSRGLRLVDYAVDLENQTSNLSVDIFNSLVVLY